MRSVRALNIIGLASLGFAAGIAWRGQPPLTAIIVASVAFIVSNALLATLPTRRPEAQP
jgi:hypothetical protein